MVLLFCFTFIDLSELPAKKCSLGFIELCVWWRLRILFACIKNSSTFYLFTLFLCSREQRASRYQTVVFWYGPRMKWFLHSLRSTLKNFPFDKQGRIQRCRSKTSGDFIMQLISNNPVRLNYAFITFSYVSIFMHNVHHYNTKQSIHEWIVGSNETSDQAINKKTNFKTFYT